MLFVLPLEDPLALPTPVDEVANDSSIDEVLRFDSVENAPVVPRTVDEWSVPTVTAFVCPCVIAEAVENSRHDEGAVCQVLTWTKVSIRGRGCIRANRAPRRSG